MRKTIFILIMLVTLSANSFAMGIGLFGNLVSARYYIDDTYSAELAVNYQNQPNNSDYFLYGGSLLYKINENSNLSLNIGIAGTVLNGDDTAGKRYSWETGIFFEPDYFVSENFMIGLRLYPVSWKAVTSAGSTVHETNYFKASIGGYFFF